MLQYLVRRFVVALITIWAISVISFIIIQLPPGRLRNHLHTDPGGWAGDDGDAGGAGHREGASGRVRSGPAHIHAVREVGMEVCKGDFGISLEYKRPVREIVGERLLMTVILAGTTALLAWGLSIPIGIYSAMRRYKWEDYTVTFIGFLGLATPDFLLALLLLWFSFRLFPDNSIGGLFSPEYRVHAWTIGRVVDLASHLWIAAFVVGTAGTAALIRVMRANLLDELHKPYVVTARAKGLKEWQVILKYPVRIALNPLVSTMGYLLPFLMSGSIIVSVVLSLPTEGPLLLRSLLSEDLFTSATILFVLGALTVLGTLLSDILLGILDPRIRYVK